jgi:hypothetical protein
MNYAISSETRDALMALLEGVARADARLRQENVHPSESTLRRQGAEAACLLPHLRSALPLDLEGSLDAVVEAAMATAS